MPGEILKGHSSQPVLWPSAKQTAGTKPSDTARAELERTTRLEQARRDGFAAGIAAANQEADRTLSPAIEKVGIAIAEAARSRNTLREQATDDVVQLAIAIASHVVHHEVAVDPDVLKGLLKAAFSKLQAQEIARARAHPQFEPRLRRCLNDNRCPENLILLSDHGMKPGELVFEFDQKLDASAEADLSEIENGLSDKLEETA